VDPVLIIVAVLLAVGLLALLTVIGSRSRERHVDPDEVRVDEMGLEPEPREERPKRPRFPAAEREQREGRFSREEPVEAEDAEEPHDEHSPPEAPPR